MKLGLADLIGMLALCSLRLTRRLRHGTNEQRRRTYQLQTAPFHAVRYFKNDPVE